MRCSHALRHEARCLSWYFLDRLEARLAKMDSVVARESAGYRHVDVTLQAEELILLKIFLSLQPRSFLLVQQGAELVGPIGRRDAVIADDVLCYPGYRVK